MPSFFPDKRVGSSGAKRKHGVGVLEKKFFGFRSILALTGVFRAIFLSMSTSKPITIGNAQGFWGDSPSAPATLLRQYPELDFLTLDYLAEVSLSILAAQRAKDPSHGYARDFIEVVRSLLPLWKDGAKTRVVCNAGGLNPVACAEAVRATLKEAGLEHMRVGLVTGDDVLDALKSAPDTPEFGNWENGASIDTVLDHLNTANAYIGAPPVKQVLDEGAQIVVTGRVADPSLCLGICMHAYGWAQDDYDKLAAGTVAGHILECGTQACGGISTDWLELADPVSIGFPIVEVAPSGDLVVTKAPNTGGAVNNATVKEQLLYEISDPKNYISPDCKVDFTALELEEIGPNRVAVRHARGAAPTDTYKVSATYRDGWRASSMLTIFGRDAVTKAQRCGAIVFERLKRNGITFENTLIECLGANACAPNVPTPGEFFETVLRISVYDHDRAKLDAFAKEIVPLVTSGPQGITGYAAGRPKPSPVFAYWPCLIEKSAVQVKTQVL